jgi:site-specific recombinase XerD
MKLKLVQPEKMAKSPKSAPPARRRNKEVRAREYLTLEEVLAMRDAAKRSGRNGFRDSLLLLVIYRHGLRATEAASLTWEQVHFDDGALHVERVKHGTPSTHPIEGDELRMLRKLKRDARASRFVFCSERGAPLSIRSIHHIVKQAGEAAGLPFPCHPHMLRHARGYSLAQRGVDTRAIQAFLGHRDIKSTTVYTELDASRFRGMSRD